MKDFIKRLLVLVCLIVVAAAVYLTASSSTVKAESGGEAPEMIQDAEWYFDGLLEEDELSTQDDILSDCPDGYGILQVRSWISTDSGIEDIDGCSYIVYAAKDIYVDGEILFKAGQRVADITNEFSRHLPYGHYLVVLNDIPNGYVYDGCDSCKTADLWINESSRVPFTTFYFHTKKEEMQERADVNMDGRVNASDALIILQMAVGIWR